MHEYPNVYTQIQNIYDKLNTQIEEDINLQEYLKNIPKDYTQRIWSRNTKHYPKSILKNVDEIYLEIIPKIM